MKTRWSSLRFAVMALILCLGVGLASAASERQEAPTSPGTGFTYQGQIIKDGAPYTGLCELTFGLWDAASAGSQVGSSQVESGVSVADGIFTVQLNEAGQFGASAFNGNPRWLETSVQCSGDPGATLLGRQQVTATPYALYAVTAGSVSGVVPIANGGTGSTTQNFVGLSGAQTVGGVKAFSSAPAFNAAGGAPFSVANSTVVSGLNADLLDGQHASGLQNRVSGECAVGSSIRSIHADGSVECEQPVTYYFPLMLPQYLNLASVDSGLKGFVGGFSDGRYSYFVPNNNGSLFGKVARVDQNNYTTSGVTILDLTLVDPGLKGFYGGFTDGLFGYFVPNNNGSLSGKAARVNLQNFTTGGVTVLDLAAVDSGLKGFRGGFTDGNASYFVPYANDSGSSGKVARVSTLFFSTDGVTVLDLTTVNSFLKGFNGGFTDGQYGYFVPYNNGMFYHGVVARVNLQNFAAGGVTWLNLAAVDSELAGFTSGFTDGRYGYFVPYQNNSGVSGKVARVDLKNFTTSGVTVLDLAVTHSALKGFAGGFTDGNYGYFLPYSGNLVARVDLKNFTASGVTMRNTWFSSWGGSFTDGRYGYFVPFSAAGSPDGQVGRIQLFSGVGGP